jgi:hypothetical protein
MRQAQALFLPKWKGERMIAVNRLISAILIQVVKDWQRPEYRSEIQMFLNSEWFDELAEAIELDPVNYRIKLKADKFQVEKVRAAYRSQKGKS